MSSTLSAAAPAFQPAPSRGDWWRSLPTPSPVPGLVRFLPNDNNVVTSRDAAEARHDALSCVTVSFAAVVVVRPVTQVSSLQVVASLGGALGAVLSLSDSQFWAHLLHDTELSACVDSYLRFKARPHDLDAEKVASSQDEALSRAVLLVYLRCATPVVDAATHATLLRRCPLVSVPQLLDLAALFGPGNTDLTAQVVASLMTAAPWLREGFSAAGAAAADNLLQLAERCTEACKAPSPLLDDTARRELADAASYFADCGATVAALVTCCPQSAIDLVSGDGAGLFHALAVVYDNTVELFGRAEDPDSAALRATLSRAQAAMGRAAWALLHAALLRPDAGSAASRREALIMTVLSMSSTDEGGGRLLSHVGQRHDVANALVDAQLGLDPAQHAQLVAAFSGPSSEPSHAASTPDSVQLMSRIAAVRDVLPHYGEGFVAACLDALGQDAERVMAALLDGSLPATVATLDTKLTLPAYKRTQPDRTSGGRGRLIPRPRPAPQPAGYRKHAQRYAWQRDEALELLDTRDAAVISAALHAGARISDDEAGDGAATHARFRAEYDDDFDDEDDSVLGVPAPKAAFDDDTDGDTGANAAAGVLDAANATQLRGTPADGSSRKFWLHEGRVYTYSKQGATLVMAASAAEAHAIGQARIEAEKALIYGLGRGGNRAVAPVPEDDADAGRPAGASDSRADGGLRDPDSAGGRGRGRGRGKQNKAAVGNHHRRDRAAAKTQRALLGGGGIT